MDGRLNLLDVARERVVPADGAMGTELQRRGLEPGGCGESWNAEHPHRVESIHRAHLDAGAEVLLSNTFGGTRIALDRHGLGARARKLNRAGAAIARSVAGDDAWVLGDIGPFGGFLAPLGPHDPAHVETAFREQAEALLEGGVDGILVETMTALDELELALRAARDAGSPFVIGSVAFDATRVGFRTMMGATPAEAAGTALAAGADALGANCGTGLDMDSYAGIVRAYRETAADVVVLVKANAGTPRVDGGVVVYDTTPEDMAVGVSALVEAGASIVGGCCGTTPEFTAAIARAVPR